MPYARIEWATLLVLLRDSLNVNILEMTLRERLRTHKVFIKDQCFYLNYHKFSIKLYVVDVY